MLGLGNARIEHWGIIGAREYRIPFFASPAGIVIDLVSSGTL